MQGNRAEIFGLLVTSRVNISEVKRKPSISKKKKGSQDPRGKVTF